MNFVYITSGSRYLFDRKTVRRKTKEFLAGAGLDEAEVSLLVVGSRKSRELNLKYREKDEEILALSFPLEEPRGPDGILRLGDVVICYSLARQKAAREKKMVDEVMWELVEHGLKQLVKLI